MKIKMDYKKALGEETRLIGEIDKLRFEIERFKRMDLVEKSAAKLGMQELTPNDFETIVMK